MPSGMSATDPESCTIVGSPWLSVEAEEDERHKQRTDAEEKLASRTSLMDTQDVKLKRRSAIHVAYDDMSAIAEVFDDMDGCILHTRYVELQDLMTTVIESQSGDVGQVEHVLGSSTHDRQLLRG